MEYRWVREAVAKTLVAESDSQRRRFYESYFGIDWSNPWSTTSQSIAAGWRLWPDLISVPPIVIGAALQ